MNTKGLKAGRRRIILFLFIPILLVLVITSCNRNEDKPGETSTPSGELNKLENLEGITIIESGNESKIGDLPKYYGGNLEVEYEGSEDIISYIIKDTKEEEFLSYIKRLGLAGYEQYTNNIINETNLYTTYIKDSFVINAYYTDHNKCTRIMLEPKGHLPGLAKDNVYEKKVESLLTQVKLSSTEVQEGMSYVFRLADGSFFLIDGGWPEANYEEADKLYNILKDQADGKEIIIASWLFTHAHGDHIGTFNTFIEKYSDKVTIKQLIYNFPVTKDIAGSDSSYMLDQNPARLNAFYNNIEEYIPNVPIVKVHSGQKFFLANAEIEILFTLEDMYPKTIKETSMNGSSTIFTVTIEGQRIIFFGDSASLESQALASQYKEFLKSNMMQVVHHGYGGGTIELYKYVNPTIVLWPISYGTYEATAVIAENVHLLKNEDVKKIFVMGFNQYTLSLPYKDYDGDRIPDDKFPHLSNFEDKPIEEPETKTEVNIPDPYFDLLFDDDGKAYDPYGNVTFTQVGGTLKNNKVSYQGKTYEVMSYYGESGEYIEVNLDKIKSNKEFEDFLMNGTSFEMFVQLDEEPGKTVGFLSNNNAGGVTLYIRQASSQLNFQIGNGTMTGVEHSSNYSMAQPDITSEGVCIDSKRVAHVIGTYDEKDNSLNLYYNGILVASSDFGDKSFKMGDALYNKLGIGINVAYPSEALGETTGYTVIRSRVYNYALNADQAATAYYDCIGLLGEK